MNSFVIILVICFISVNDVWSKKNGRKKSDHKIVGGYNTDIRDVPYQAYLLLQKGTDFYQCGGSIIGDKTILTAAHCMDGITNITVRIGSSSAQSGGTQYSTTNHVSHPLFNARSFDYDVALVKLPRAMTLDGVRAKTIALPRSGASVAAGTDIIVSGWGATTEGGNVSSDLLAVNVTTISNEECNTKLNGITARMFCAGEPEGGKDSCQGDSGGPAASNDKSVQLGVVSFGVGCARPGKPGVYTRIAAVRNWIRLNSGV